MQLSGKVALVTGGRQGIGAAIVERFLLEGAKVVTCGRGARPSDMAPNIDWVQADVSCTTQISKLKDHVATHYGGLDILVNNAGVQIEKTLVDTSDDDWDVLMGANAKGVFNAVRSLLPIMASGGSIINMGSVSGNAADPGLALYNASKAFVHGLTRSVAVDHGPSVRCNAICPGWIMTAMADSAFAVAEDPAAAKQDALVRHPAGRFGTPADIANMALWLASNESQFVTGQLFTVDGGLTAASPLNPSLF
ncbi:MAG TPA: SDR family oxidoreductase [Oceanospirillaceae bacterium]|nr:SDR family oxidoreductase [Oceanospirillaceae bacterium]